MTYNQLTKDVVEENLRKRQIKIIGDYVNTKTPTEFYCCICKKSFISTYDMIRPLANDGCPKCSRRVASEKRSEIQKEKSLIKLKDSKSPLVDVLDYDIHNRIVKCLCLKCGKEYDVKYDDVIAGATHKTCIDKPRIVKPINIIQEELYELYGDTMEFDLSGYKNLKSIISYKCKICGYSDSTRLVNRFKRPHCPKCSKRKYSENKKISLEDCSGILEEYDLSVVGKYNGKSFPTQFRCNKCQRVFTTSVGYIERYQIGCVVCSKKDRMEQSKIQFDERLSAINKEIKRIGDYESYDKETTFRCSACNHIFSKAPHDLLRWCQCPYCSNNSSGEYFIKMWLDSFNIEYEPQKKFDGLIGVGGKKLSYDFYLPDFNTLIEYNGEQHYNAIEFFGGEQRLRIQQKHDELKAKYALTNNFRLLVIPYTETSISDTIQNFLFHERG